jgi:hypothetical protein
MSLPTSIARFRDRLARWVCFVLVVACGSISPANVLQAPAVSKEYQIKAAFLYNFARFVDWPAGRFSDAAAPIRIAVVGRNPFGDELENVVRGRKIGGREIIVVYHPSTDLSALDASSHHVIYIGTGEEQSLEKLAGRIGGAGALTVGESVRFSAEGGIVTFSTVDDKVRFEINADAAEGAGLKISAQLLKLATAVRRKAEAARP